jgi:hypothetical protein
MAPVQLVIPIRRACSRWTSLLPALLTLACGCATVDPKLVNAPPTGTPAKIIATWQQNVEMLPDRMQGGRLTPAVCGHVYLLNVNDTPICSNEGRLIVTLYDDHPKLAPNGTPIPLDVWEITPECMKLVQTKDQIAWGYALNLPWGSYRPDIGKVEMRVEYRPTDGTMIPSFSDPAMVTLQNNGSNAQYAVQPHVSSNQLSSANIPTGYGQSPAPANRGTLDMSFPVNNAGQMVAQPQTNGLGQHSVVQAQALNPPPVFQPTSGQPQGTPQGTPQSPAQGFNLPAQPPMPNGPNANNGQGPMTFTPNVNNHGQ